MLQQLSLLHTHNVKGPLTALHSQTGFIMLRFYSTALISFLFMFPSLTVAGVEIGGTRVIYNSDTKQASISVSNPDDRPFLIQSWVNKKEDGDDNDDTFMTTPPLFRLEPKSQNSVRVVLNNKNLPQDKESVYWLNIKSIPTTNSNANNELLIAVKTKMKLIYRPAELSQNAESAWQKITFARKNGDLIASNPTPYVISFYDIKVNGKEIKKTPMILPGQEVLIEQNSSAKKVNWRAINDYGGITTEHEVTL